MDSEPFWGLRKEFMKKYGVEYEGVDQPPPSDPAALKAFLEAKGKLQSGVDDWDVKLMAEGIESVVQRLTSSAQPFDTFRDIAHTTLESLNEPYAKNLFLLANQVLSLESIPTAAKIPSPGISCTCCWGARPPPHTCAPWMSR